MHPYRRPGRGLGSVPVSPLHPIMKVYAEIGANKAAEVMVSIG